MADVVNGRQVSIGSLELPPGYYVERDESGVYLMDPGGRQVIRLPGDVDFEKPREGGSPEASGPGGWQELCRSLLIRLSQKNAECERLGARVVELDARLEAAETERDQANAIAEDLYEFFRNRVRETIDRKQSSRRRDVH